MWKRFSIQTKLFVVMTAITVTAIAFLAVMIAVSMRSGFSQYLLEAELGRFAPLAAALAERHDAVRPGWPDLQANRRLWHDAVRQAMRQVGGGPRRPRPGADGARPPPPRDPLQLGRRLSLQGADGTTLIGRQPEGGRIARLPILRRDGAASAYAKPLGWVVLVAPKGSGHRVSDVFLSGQLRSLLLSSLLALFLSGVAAYLLARQFLAPVNRLVDAARQLSAGEEQTRIAHDRGDELGTLIDDFNHLAASLQATKEAERQWISDAAHELKTPLAVLRARIEGLQDGIYPCDAAALDDLHRSVLRLARLVSDLNALSHGQEGQLVALCAPEDLCAIIGDAIAAAKARFDEKGLTVSASLPSGFVMPCDRLRMRQLLDNLLENARRYTDAPGRVIVVLSEQAGTARLVIEDTAPSPPETSYARLFDRFYRGEASRSRHLGGSGLGLAICRAIVLGHGGEIAARPSTLGGLQIVISLPVNSQPMQSLSRAQNHDGPEPNGR